LKALTVLFEAPRLFAMASLCCAFPILKLPQPPPAYNSIQHQMFVKEFKKRTRNMQTQPPPKKECEDQKKEKKKKKKLKLAHKGRVQ
jgi:hypothetical protein